MENKFQKLIFFSGLVLILLFLTITGCMSMYSAEDATEDLAWVFSDHINENADLYAGKSIAVYYFTQDGQKSEISDYLIDLITTHIANVANERDLDIRVLGRQVLDRIMEEQNFQLSALADQSRQVELGRQLGADFILTGTVSPYGEDYQINAQVVEVASGIVRTGFVYEFYVDESF